MKPGTNPQQLQNYVTMSWVRNVVQKITTTPMLTLWVPRGLWGTRFSAHGSNSGAIVIDFHHLPHLAHFHKFLIVEVLYTIIYLLNFSKFPNFCIFVILWTQRTRICLLPYEFLKFEILGHPIELLVPNYWIFQRRY